MTHHAENADDNHEKGLEELEFAPRFQSAEELSDQSDYIGRIHGFVVFLLGWRVDVLSSRVQNVREVERKRNGRVERRNVVDRRQTFLDLLTHRFGKLREILSMMLVLL